MELDFVLRTTPATRSFLPEPVPDDTLHEILDVARFAPSGGNRQGWHVIVLRDPAVRARVAELYVLGWREYVAQRSLGVVPFDGWSASRGLPPPVDLAAARQDPSHDGGTDWVRTAPVLLAVTVDLAAVSATDTGLDRIGIVGGASVYPFCHNVLLAARNRDYGGVMATVLVRQEPAVRGLLGVPPSSALAALIGLGRPTHVLTRLRRQPVEAFTTVDRYDGAPFAVSRPD